MHPRLLVERARAAVKRHPKLKAALLPAATLAFDAAGRVGHGVNVALAPWRFGRTWIAPNLLPGLRAGIGRAAAGRQIVMLVVSELRVDPRVQRGAQTLAAAGYRVTIICPALDRPGADDPLDWGPGVTVEWLPPAAGQFAYRFPCFLGQAMLQAALAHKPFAFHAHDLNTALVGLTAGQRTGAHVVCDFHEWFSEGVVWDEASRSYQANPPRVRRANRWLERLALRKASAVITVSGAIAAELDQMAGGAPRVHLIRNIPARDTQPTRTYPSLRDTLGVAPGQSLVLYQGGIGPSRLLEPVIEALAHAPQTVLAIRGPAIEHFAGHYEDVAARAGVAARLHLLPPVLSADVVAAANGADAGLWTLPNLAKNFAYALPNKVFEYLYSGLPVLAADYPEVRRIVVGHEVGLVFDPYDPRSIGGAMNRLATEAGLRAALAARIPAALVRLDADAEWRRLVAIYDTLGREGTLAGLPQPFGHEHVAPARAAP